MIGGAYLCYEGAEKVWHKLSGHHDAHAAGEEAMPDENTLVSGAVRTDFILSAEIMVISLNEVVDEPFVSRAVILAIVALAITVLVYGVVGLIVKMDDVGLRLAERSGKAVAAVRPRPGQGDAAAAHRPSPWSGPPRCCGSAGTSCWWAPTSWACTSSTTPCTTWRRPPHDATGALGAVVGWLVNTLASALLGLLVGAAIVAVMSLTVHRRKARPAKAIESH